MTGAGQPALSAQNPWPGLAAFTERDRDFFRGRPREADELARLVRRERLGVLYGRSGLGKSSLLAAGLSPLLRDDQHLPVLLRIDYRATLSPRAQVWQALLAEAQRWQISIDPPRDGESLWAFFHRAGAGCWNARNRPVLPVLVFDQFEELFSLGLADEAARAQSAAFTTELADLVEDRMPLALQQALEADPQAAEQIDSGRRGCKVVLSFREDDLAKIESLRSLMPSVMRNRYRLLPMDREQAAAVVASGGDLVSPELAPRILGLAWNNQPEPPPDDDRAMAFDPALLSVICSELNRLRLEAGEARINLDRLKTSGAGILAGFYDRSMAGVADPLRQFVEDELVTPSGVRDSRALDDALARPGVVAAELMHLVDGRLLRLDERFGAQRLELTHDVLTGVVAERRRSRRARQAEAEALAREARVRQQQRRLRYTVATAVAGAAMAIGLALWAGTATLQAQRAQARATASEVAASASSEAASAALADAAAAKAHAVELEQGAELVRAGAAEAARQAGQAQAAADAATAQASALLRQAQASDMLMNARLMPTDRLDRALLLGALAAQAYPERIDARLAQLARLLAIDELAALRRIGHAVRSTATSADGRWLALGTSSGRLQLYETSGWQLVADWAAGVDDTVGGLAFSPRGDLLAAHQPGAVTVWRTADRVAAHRLGGLTEQVDDLAFDGDGRRLALRNRRGNVSVWTLAHGGGAQAVVPIAGSFGVCMAFDRQSRLWLSGRDGHAVWADGGLERRAARRPREERLMAISPDCQWSAVASVGPSTAPGRTGPATVRLERTFDGELVRTLGTHENLDDRRYLFADDGRTLFDRAERTVKVWRTSPFQEGQELSLRANSSLLLPSPDGSLLASADSQQLEVLDTGDGTVRFSMPLVQQPNNMAFGAGQASLGLVVDSNRRETEVLSAVRLAGQRPMLRRDGAPYAAEALEFNRSGNVLLTVRGQGFDIWDAQRGSFRHRFDEVVQSEFSPDGSLAALVSPTGQVQVVALEAPGRVRYTRAAEPDEQGRRLQVALGSDNRTLVVLRGDGALEVHDLQRRGPTRRLPGQAEAVVMALSPDLQWIATGDSRGAIALHAPDGRRAVPAVKLPAAHSQAVARLAFSPDSRLLASGGDDATVLLHALAPLRLARRFDGLATGRIEWLVFIENGAVLMAGNSRNVRELWDLRTGLSLGRIGAGTGGIRTLELSPDARRLAVLGTDDRVELRDWNNQSLVRDTCAVVGRNLDCDEWRQFVPGLPYRRLCPPPAEAPARCQR